MKRILCVFMLLLLLCAAGCAKNNLPKAVLSSENTTETLRVTQHLCATWASSGTSEDGSVYTENFTLNEDCTALIRLEYQGEENYQTLTGTYETADGILTVHIAGEQPYDEVFAYTLDSNLLTLTQDGKEIVYRRVD